MLAVRGAAKAAIEGQELRQIGPGQAPCPAQVRLFRPGGIKAQGEGLEEQRTAQRRLWEELEIQPPSRPHHILHTACQGRVLTPDDDMHPPPEQLAPGQEELPQEGIQLLFERDVFWRRVSQGIEPLQIGQGTLLAQPCFFHGLIDHGDIDHEA